MIGRKFLTLGLVLAALLYMAPTAHAIFVTFEEGVGNNGVEINTQYSGITFESAGSGIPWVYADITTSLYNASSWPSGTIYNSGEYWMNDLVCTWTTESGYDGKIGFDAEDATFVQINYCSNSNFYLEAYNSSGVLLTTDVGDPNLRFSHGNSSGPGTVRVDAPPGELISYVLLHDSGNFWVVDNLFTDATGVSGPGDMQIQKFNDYNGNGVLDAGEPLMGGWQFHVTGPDYDEWFTTNASGVIDIVGLGPGQYTITETPQPGWTCTTANPQVVEVFEGMFEEVRFGNMETPFTPMVFFSPWYYIHVEGQSLFTVKDADVAGVNMLNGMCHPFFDGSDWGFYDLNAFDFVDEIPFENTAEPGFIFSVRTSQYLSDGNSLGFWAHKEDIVMFDFARGTYQLLLDGQEHGLTDIDAVSMMEDGSIILSTATNCFCDGGSLPDFYAHDQDLIRFYPGSEGSQGDLELWLDTFPHGINTLDGVDVEGGIDSPYEMIYFSVEEPAWIYQPPLSNVYLREGDIGVYDKMSGTFDLFMKGYLWGIDSVDALSVSNDIPQTRRNTKGHGKAGSKTAGIVH